jgi:hypothetical protein
MSLLLKLVISSQKYCILEKAYKSRTSFCKMLLLFAAPVPVRNNVNLPQFWLILLQSCRARLPHRVGWAQGVPALPKQLHDTVFFLTCKSVGSLLFIY